MRSSSQKNPLNGKLFSDQIVQINARDDYVAAQDAGGLACQSKTRREPFENFQREKGDLAFVIAAIIVKPVTANSAAGNAFDLLNLDEGKIIGRATVMPKVVVSGRYEDLANDHRLTDAEANFANNPAAEALLQFA